MIKIFYDYQIFAWQKYGGISRYIYELAIRLFESDDLDLKILAGFFVNQYLKHTQPGLAIGTLVPKLPKTGNLIRIFDRNFSRLWFGISQPQIVHETFYDKESVTPKSAKTVLTVYDFTDEKFSPGNPIIAAKTAAIKRADHLICISENTRKDLLERFDIEPSMVSVIYLASSLKDIGNASNSEEQSIEGNNQVDSPYILYVGDRSGYKNFNRLLEAYGKSPSLVKDFKLICFGSLPLSDRDFALMQSLGIPEGRVTWMTGDDTTLATFYKRAAALAYPSLYEGFGFPPLEALSMGCPVICSNTSSMPEVSGDAAEYFDPYTVESITAALEKVLYSATRVEQLVQRGNERAKLFSWDEIAEQTKQVYLSLVDK
jgi:glycosyltransferase involved in cell wall biosynthesis